MPRKRKEKCQQKGCCHWHDCPFCYDTEKCRTALDVVGDEDPFEQLRGRL